MSLSRSVAAVWIAVAAVLGLSADRVIWPRLDALPPPDPPRPRAPARPQEPPQHGWCSAPRSHLSADAASDLPGAGPKWAVTGARGFG